MNPPLAFGLATALSDISTSQGQLLKNRPRTVCLPPDVGVVPPWLASMSFHLSVMSRMVKPKHV